MRKHVALFLTSLAGGGAERITLTLAEELAKRGFKIDLVVTNARGPLKSEVPQNVNLIDFEASRILGGFLPLVRYLKRTRPEVLCSHMKPTNCLAVWACKLAKIETKIVLVEHNNLSSATKNSQTLKSKILPILMKYSYPYADDLISVSNGVADDLSEVLGIPKNEITTIYNPVITPKLINRSREEINHAWFGPETPPILLGVGSLTKQKNFSLLINAFAQIRKEKECKLIILGEGEERTNLENLIAELDLVECTYMPGFVNNPYKFMGHADVFILSSIHEGLPTVLIEALACGTPVVSTDCPSGPKEILENGKWGRLVEPNNELELSQAILKTLKSPTKNFSKRANHFCVDKAVNSYINFFLRI